MAIIGRYILRPEIFAILQSLPPGKGVKSITDGLSQLVHAARCTAAVSRRTYDIGDKFGFVRATVAYELKRPDLRSGSRISQSGDKLNWGRSSVGRALESHFFPDRDYGLLVTKAPILSAVFLLLIW